ncbi:DUF885 family protein [Colwelliaceae bacterium 6471]
MKKQLLSSALASLLLISACDSNSVPKETTATKSEDNKSSSQASVKAQSLTQLYQQATQILFQNRALSATLFGLSEQSVGQYYADKMEDFSPANEAKLRADLLALSEKTTKFPLASTLQADIDNQKVMANLTRYFAGHADFPIGYIDTWMGLSPFIVNQINGPLISIPRYMQSDQKINDEKDALDYIARLGKFDQLVASIEAKQAADAEQNWIPPKVTLNGAIHYLEGFISSSATEHPLIVSFVDKLTKIPTISDERKTALTALATQNLVNVVYPAYRSVTAKTKTLLAKAREESGIWAQPNGSSYYQDAILQLGDSTLSADEIHTIGLDEVKRISEQMDQILIAQGYTQGSVGERMVSLNSEARFLYPDSAAGRAQLLQDLNGYIAEITEKMSPLFKTKPEYQVEVRSFPVEIQDGAPGGEYTPPSVDGSKPGIYWINLRDMKANPKFGLKTLTYHEANPGHHWQVALNMEQESLPFLRRIAPYNAYVEGWALYSEQVAAELGLYENDPFGNLGRLQAELFRAVRLVVDTGMHHKRWTREQAIAYMAKTTGSAESDVVSEIERYMAWPGQALGYKLGMLKILSLRDHAKTALADKFDLATFHDIVLLGGAVPMTVLEQKINDWIASYQ